MAQLILNKNLIRSGKYKGDQKKYEGKMILSGNSETKIWELANGKGFAVTRFSNEFFRIYASLRGAKLSYMWQFHNH